MKKELDSCIHLIQETFTKKLLNIYLYGSAVQGGLQKYSDIDLFVVLNKPSTSEEKSKLIAALLDISGIYMIGPARPIELTIVVESEINPWRYPPTFDFQYGEWLRDEFETGNIEPWPTKEMPDLAVLITQIHLASKTLLGKEPAQTLPQVPYNDFVRALTNSLPNLQNDLETDTRNVLLTLARIWCTISTDTIQTKPAAADWALERLPETLRAPLIRAKAICIGKEEEKWDDIGGGIKPCAEYILEKVKESRQPHDPNRRT